MPEDLRRIFNEDHIELVWLYLDEHFTINLKAWRDFFSMRCRVQPDITPCEMFVRFGIEQLEPPINKLLLRKDGHPTWLTLIRHVVKVNKKEVWEIYSKDNPKTRYKIINPR